MKAYQHVSIEDNAPRPSETIQKADILVESIKEYKTILEYIDSSSSPNKHSEISHLLGTQQQIKSASKVIFDCILNMNEHLTLGEIKEAFASGDLTNFQYAEAVTAKREVAILERQRGHDDRHRGLER